MNEVEEAIAIIESRFRGYSIDYRPTAKDWPHQYRLRLVVPSWDIDAYRFTAWGNSFLDVLTEALRLLNLADSVKAQEIHMSNKERLLL